MESLLEGRGRPLSLSQTPRCCSGLEPSIFVPIRGEHSTPHAVRQSQCVWGRVVAFLVPGVVAQVEACFLFL